MPLPEIADFLQNRDIDRIEEKLQQQKQAVLQKQQALKRMEQKIDHRLRWLRTRRARRLTRFASCSFPPAASYGSAIAWRIGASADMEAPIRKLDRSDAEAVVFLGKVGLGISAEHLQKAQTAQYDGIFLILDREDIYTGETAGAAGNTLCAAALSGQPCRCACAVSEASSLYGRAPDADFRLFPGGHAH